MKKTVNKIALIILITSFVTNLILSQTIKSSGNEIKVEIDTKKEISVLIDSLTGTWRLTKTIRYEHGDTIIQEPSMLLWETPKAKPYTSIEFEKTKHFTILQDCMKCPYLLWKGMYEIEMTTINGLSVFYLNFIDNRQKKRGNRKKRKEVSLTYEFNGYITKFDNGELILTDKEASLWVYERI